MPRRECLSFPFAYGHTSHLQLQSLFTSEEKKSIVDALLKVMSEERRRGGKKADDVSAAAGSKIAHVPSKTSVPTTDGVEKIAPLKIAVATGDGVVNDSDAETILGSESPSDIDALWSIFTERVNSHLHVILAVSPNPRLMRARMSAFPALAHACVVDVYHEWAPSALTDIAAKALMRVHLPSEVQGGGDGGASSGSGIVNNGTAADASSSEADVASASSPQHSLLALTSASSSAITVTENTLRNKLVTLCARLHQCAVAAAHKNTPGSPSSASMVSRAASIGQVGAPVHI